MALLTPSHAGTDHTNSTVISDYFAQSGSGSTAFTSPSLYPPAHSPGYKPHSLGNIDEESGRLAPPMQNPDDSLDESLYADDPASACPPEDVRRGPSVKSRASTYEQSLSGQSGVGIDRPKSRAASPFRLPPSPGLEVPRSPQYRSHSPVRSQSPMRLPPSPRGHSRSPAPRPYSPVHHPPRSSSPLRLPQPTIGRAASPLRLSPASHQSAASSRELPHSPCGTMPSHPYDDDEPAPTHQTRRVPVPAGASEYANVSPSPQRAQGGNQARRMIAQWENGTLEPDTPSPVKSFGGQRPHGYLDDKPLPIPTATAIPASASMPWPPPNSSRTPRGGAQMPTPLRGPQTPNSRSEYMSPSSWSPVQRGKRQDKSKTDWAALSPNKSPRKSPMKRSPFKEIVNKITGRKKDKEHHGPELHNDQSRRFMNLNDDQAWFSQPRPLMDSNAAFSDRMGDEEMSTPQDLGAIRSSAVLFLSPAPGSSATAWGSWLTAWATLTHKSMSITYAPTIPGGSPFEVKSQPYASIPKPARETHPQVELDMHDCVEVRSLRPSEVRGRGIPPVPQGGGSEVLEIAFSLGLKRYVAVEGVAGRLGWVSAIWDVLLACKQEPGANMNIPPPSPSIAPYSSTGPIIIPSHEAPVQRYGDTWVAAGELDGSNSARGTPVRSLPNTPDAGHAPRVQADPGMATFDLQPGDIVPPGIRPGDTISTLRTGTRGEGSHVPQDAHPLPPLPPPKSLPKSVPVSERIKAWTADEPEVHSARPLPFPVPRTQSEPESNSGSGDGATAESRFSSTRSADRSYGTSAGATFTTATGTSVPLRKALVQMFDEATAADATSTPNKSRSTVMEERIRAWQPHSEDTPPPLSRASTRRQAESTLSVDPSDLNPSRSASQVRPRVDSQVALDLGAVNAGLAAVPEAVPTPPERSFGPRAPREASPALPATVPTQETESTKSTKSPELLEPSQELSEPTRARSPGVTTPRMNARLLAAAAIFEPALAEEGSAPSSLTKRRKAVPAALRSTPETVAKPASPFTAKSLPREPKSDVEAISEIRSVRSGLRSVKQEKVESPTAALSVRGTEPLNLRKSPLVKSPPVETEPKPSALFVPVSQRATSSTSATSQVTSVTPETAAVLDRVPSSSVEAGEGSVLPSRAVGTSSVVPLDETALPHTPEIMTRLDTHTAEHDSLARQLESVRTDMTAVAASVSGLGVLMQAKQDDSILPELTSRLDTLDSSVRDVHGAVNGPNVPPSFAQRFDALNSELRGIQMVLQETSANVAGLAMAHDGQEKELPAMPAETYTEVSEPRLPEIHAKLDALAHLIQEVLQRQGELASETSALVAAGSAAGASASRELDTTPEVEDKPEAAVPATPVAEPATAAQLETVTGMVSKLEGERALQAQQTADIARYLGDLNGWLEKFVQNSGGELGTMSKRLEGLAGETALVPEIHGMLAQQLARPVGEGGGVQSQRVDALVGMMAEERERQQQQVNVVEHVIGLLDKQRHDNENLLRAVATDLTSEIRGERVKFIDAMQQATSMNMQIHVDEFKKALTNEVSQSMRELGELREQKKVLQHQIADLFSLMAKHGEENRAPAAMPPGMFPSPGPRSLPVPPN